MRFRDGCPRACAGWLSQAPFILSSPMTNPVPQKQTDIGPIGADGGQLATTPTGTAAGRAGAGGVDGCAGSGGSAVRAAGRARKGDRRVVVCGGVRGVFARTAGGDWVLTNRGELGVLEGLGGSCDGVSRLRGMEAALAARVAGPGDLVRLGRCLRRVAAAKRVCCVRIPDDLVAAVTVVCAWWEHPAARAWLCWVLSFEHEGNLSGETGAGPGLDSWLAHNLNLLLAACEPNPRLVPNDPF